MSLATVAHRLILDTYLRISPAAFFTPIHRGTETATTETAGFQLVVVVLVFALEVFHRRVTPWTCLLAIGVLDRVAGLLVAELAVAAQWFGKGTIKP
jgi:hypothetical protein